MRIHLLLFASLLSVNAFAQEAFISVKGQLIDSQSKEPIPYSSVYLKGKTIGTTTNQDGKFIFNIPSTFNKDTLIVSTIGYDHFKSVVSVITDKENVIELNPSSTLLNEVVVKSSNKELTGKDIVKKAVAAISENYPMKPFIIEGFFRDLQTEMTNL